MRKWSTDTVVRLERGWQYTCGKCKETFSTVRLLREHKQTAHSY